MNIDYINLLRLFIYLLSLLLALTSIVGIVAMYRHYRQQPQWKCLYITLDPLTGHRKLWIKDFHNILCWTALITCSVYLIIK